MLPSSRETRAVVRILEPHLKKRTEKGHDLSCNAPTGRQLFVVETSHKYGCYLAGLFLLGLGCMIALGLIIDPEKTPVIPAVLGSLFFLGAGIGVFRMGQIPRPKLEIYENEIHHLNYLGKRTTINYDEIEAFSCGLTFREDSGTTKTKLNIEGSNDAFSFQNGHEFYRKRLKSLINFVSDILVGKFWGRLENGDKVPFGNHTLSSAGLHVKDGKLVPYEQISEIRFLKGEGKALLFFNNANKPGLKLKANSKNFMPGIKLLELLSESNLTYKEFCGSQVIPVFGSGEE